MFRSLNNRNLALLGVGLLSMLLHTARGVTAGRCNQLKAVYTTYGFRIHFIFGDNLMVKYDEWGRPLRNAFHLAYDKPVTAAVGSPDSYSYILVSGKSEEAFDGSGDVTSYWPEMEPGHVPEMFRDYSSIDAVVRREDRFYYFAGCHFISVVITGNRMLRWGSLEDFGLPCDVDAAWNSDRYGMTMVVKGSAVYPWSLENDKSDAPRALLEYYPFLTDLNLCE